MSTERVQCIQVKEGSTGHSYSTVFSNCMDGNVESITINDPYIRARHQLHNFVRFCELAVKKCRRLKAISLSTGKYPQNEVYEQYNTEVAIFYWCIILCIAVFTSIIIEGVGGKFERTFSDFNCAVF